MQSRLANLNLQPTEHKILELKYASLPFGKMEAAELKVAASALLIKISFITGWSLYEDPKSHGILKEQFELKIVESFPNVNVDEMLYAFRQNTTVKDWGKAMNLALIDEVMIPYLENRFEISKLEESLSKPKALPPPEDEPMTDDEFLELNKNIFIKSKNFGLISTKCYDILVKQGKIKLTDEQKAEIERKARGNFFSIENKEYTTFLTQDEIARKIKQDCKKWATAEYFNL